LRGRREDRAVSFDHSLGGATLERQEPDSGGLGDRVRYSAEAIRHGSDDIYVVAEQ
jgi:hypothetical protein